MPSALTSGLLPALDEGSGSASSANRGCCSHVLWWENLFSVPAVNLRVCGTLACSCVDF